MLASFEDAYAIALDGDQVFVSQGVDSGGIRRIPNQGGAATTLTEKDGRSFHIALGASHVFYTTGVTGQVKRVGKSGGKEVLACRRRGVLGVCFARTPRSCAPCAGSRANSA